VADLRAIPQDPVLGAASGGLRSLRSGLDVVPLPEFLGGGLGQAMIGKAPEEVERWSYGESPFRQNPTHSPFLPQFKADRAQGVADTALLPLAETAVLGKMAGAGLRSGYKAVADAALHGGPDQFFQQSRRDFLKKSGAVAGTAAAAGAVPPLLNRGLRALDSDVAKPAASVAAKAVARASPAEFARLVRIHHAGTLKALADLEHSNFQPIHLAENIDFHNFIRTPEGKRWQAAKDADVENIPHWSEIAPMRESAPLQEAFEAKKKAFYDERRDLLAKQREDPKWHGYKTIDEMEDEWLAAGKSYKEAGQLRKAEMRNRGWLPDSEVETKIKFGGKHVDPDSGLHAHLNKKGQLTWFSPRTGDAKSYRHWVYDDPFLPDTRTYTPKHPWEEDLYDIPDDAPHVPYTNYPLRGELQFPPIDEPF